MIHRLLLCWLLFATLVVHAEPLPQEFADTLNTFKAEGTKGWAFTQTTKSRKHSMVEAYDPSKPEMTRWKLIEKDGREPTADELKKYRENQTRRTKGETAPDVTKQLDRDSAERISDDAERSVYRFRLKPGGNDDSSAEHMQSTFTFHKPTRTIEQVTLESFEPFSPTLAVKIEEARTVMNYSLPTDDRPTLLKSITVRVRGRAMLFKSLDEDMSVEYSDHRYAFKRPPQPVAAAE